MGMKFKRIFRPHSEWEEFPAGMWRVVHGDKSQMFVDAAANLMRVPEAFKSAMLEAVKNWPISCEVNLTAWGMNRQAWLGHAGCCIAANSPENCTRLGWHCLTIDEQNEANRVADEAIAIWEAGYAEKITVKTANRNGRSVRCTGTYQMDF